MFYKRISDLHPLGIPTNNDWNNITPLPVPDNYSHNYDIAEVISQSLQYDTLDDPYTLTISPPPASFISNITVAFNNNVWQNNTQSTLDYNDIDIIPANTLRDDPTEDNLFAKSLWFEVSISKDKSNRPTRNPRKIQKYQSKRINAYNFINNLGELDINTNIINSDYIKVDTLKTNDLSAKVILATLVDGVNISADTADISSWCTNILSTTTLSSQIGIINKLSGERLYYKNAQFENISTTTITAHDCILHNEISAVRGIFTDISTDRVTATTNTDLNNAVLNNFNISEVYRADANYTLGRLIQFGNKHNKTTTDGTTVEICDASPNRETPDNSIVHGVIGELEPFRLEYTFDETAGWVISRAHNSPRSGLVLRSDLIKHDEWGLIANTSYPFKAESWASLDPDLRDKLEQEYEEYSSEFDNLICNSKMEVFNSNFCKNKTFPKAVILAGRTKVKALFPSRGFLKGESLYICANHLNKKMGSSGCTPHGTGVNDGLAIGCVEQPSSGHYADPYIDPETGIAYGDQIDLATHGKRIGIILETKLPSKDYKPGYIYFVDCYVNLLT